MSDAPSSPDGDISAVEASRILLSLMPNRFSPIIDQLLLLQDNDIERLRGSIYRDAVRFCEKCRVVSELADLSIILCI